MNLELNNEQYKELIKLIFLGEWVVNAIRENPEDYEFNETEQNIYSQFKNFKSQDLIEYDQDSQTYLPTKKMEKEMMPYLEEFLENSRGDFIGYN